MNEALESFHLMAVPRHLTSEVLNHGGKFIRLKSPASQSPKNFELIYFLQDLTPKIHILDSIQHRDYEMFGKSYSEEMSYCKVVFEQQREGGYQIVQGDLEEVTCPECRKAFRA